MYRPEKKYVTLQYQPGKGLKVYNPNAVDLLSEDTRILCISKVGIDIIPDDNYQRYISI